MTVLVVNVSYKYFNSYHTLIITVNLININHKLSMIAGRDMKDSILAFS